MGGPKALLRGPDGRTFLETVATGMRHAGLARVVVVVGPWWDGQGLPGGCDGVVNPDPDQGVISSLRLAIRHAGVSAQAGVFLALVDHAAVRPETYRLIGQAHLANPQRIIVPTFRGESGVRRGHPVVFPGWAVPEFFGAEADEEGPRAVVRAHPEAVLELEVSDPGVVMDMDAPECYQQWLTRGLP